MRRLVVFLILGAIFCSCEAATSGGTVSVEVTRQVPVTVQVKELVQEVVEKPVPVTVEVEVTRLVEAGGQAPKVVTATAPPTPEPPPQPPAPVGPQIEILSHSQYVMRGWYKIVGEVRNNTHEPMTGVKIVVTLYDADGKVSGTDFTYAKLDTILPGGKSPFSTGTDNWEGTVGYKLSVEGRRGNLGRQDLEILSHQHFIQRGWLKVQGEVQNNGETAAEGVKLVITLYDAGGTVIGTDFTYAKLDEILPGGSSPFSSGTDHWDGFDHYEIQVEGR